MLREGLYHFRDAKRMNRGGGLNDVVWGMGKILIYMIEAARYTEKSVHVPSVFGDGPTPEYTTTINVPANAPYVSADAEFWAKTE
jgi:hypothetical protein